jgi:fido (protein-threonine AMPylation protein)/DNA-binding XRE family transcriptional regulator
MCFIKMTKFVMNKNDKMKSLIKTHREAKGMLIRELAQAIGVDQALVSKFESGSRRPTRIQLGKLAQVLEIPFDMLLVEWLKDGIVRDLYAEPLAMDVLKSAEEEIRYRKSVSGAVKYGAGLNKLLRKIDRLKGELDKFRHQDSHRVAQALELEYTYESNRIEGNTLTLRETDLVVNEGMTISGKSMREHLEAINHKDAVEFVKQLVEKDTPITERSILSLHNLVLRGIEPSMAGKYRHVQVLIQGSAHVPPQPYLVLKQMEDFLFWYKEHAYRMHPVVLAAEMHERLVTIHPFIDGNGRTSRLLMNLVLLKHGYVIANLKGDARSRLRYYEALEKSQTTGDKADFFLLIAETEAEGLERYLSVLKG